MCERGDTAPAFVKLVIMTEGSPLFSERKFPVTNTIREIKQKLELITGASANSMRLELRDSEGASVIKALTDNDDARIDAYPICDGLVLHVSDPQLDTEEFKDLSRVEKVILNYVL